MSFSRAMIAVVMLALVGGCSTGSKEVGGGDPFFGEAVRYNAAVQTINPDPVYGPDDAKPGDNGEKGAAAVKRYRTDKVKPVESLQTTQSEGASGSSGSSTPR